MIRLALFVFVVILTGCTELVIETSDLVIETSDVVCPGSVVRKNSVLSRHKPTDQVIYIRYDLTNATWGSAVLDSMLTVKGSSSVSTVAGGQPTDPFVIFKIEPSTPFVPTMKRTEALFNPPLVNILGPIADVDIQYRRYESLRGAIALGPPKDESSGSLIDGNTLPALSACDYEKPPEGIPVA